MLRPGAQLDTAPGRMSHASSSTRRQSVQRSRPGWRKGCGGSCTPGKAPRRESKVPGHPPPSASPPLSSPAGRGLHDRRPPQESLSQCSSLAASSRKAAPATEAAAQVRRTAHTTPALTVDQSARGLVHIVVALCQPAGSSACGCPVRSWSLDRRDRQAPSRASHRGDVIFTCAGGLLDAVNNLRNGFGAGERRGGLVGGMCRQ